MTANNPFSDPNFGAEASGTNNPFSNPEFGKPSGFTRRVADQGIKLAQGVVGVPEATVGVADLVTGGQAGKLAEQAGVRFKDAKDILGEYLSPEQKAADAEVQKADGFLPTLGAMVRNPSTIIGSAVESAPSMLVGGAASRGLLAVAPKIGAIAAGAMGEGLTAAGQNAEQVRQEDPNGTLTPQQSAILAASGALTGGISLASGKLANKLGIGDVQTMLASGKLGTVGEEAAQTAATKGFTRKLAEGFANEGVLQELPQSYQEQVAQNLAQDKPWDEGAAKAGAQGMMAGALMGGAANAASHFAEVGHEASPEKPDVAPSTQVVPALGYTPGINTHTVFPDGSVVVDSNTSSGEQNVRDMMRANRLARVGVEEAGSNSPLTSAAIVAVDTGADQGIVPAPQQVQAGSDQNLKQSEIDQATAEVAAAAAETESAADAAKPGAKPAAQPMPAYSLFDGSYQDGDLHDVGGKPYRSEVAARMRMNATPGSTMEQFSNGFVIRRPNAAVVSDETADEVKSAPTQEANHGESTPPAGLDQPAAAKPVDQLAGGRTPALGAVPAGGGKPGNAGVAAGAPEPDAAVVAAGGGTAAVAPKAAPTREQAIANASSAANDVLTKGGTEADANRAATDSLIGQMAGNPGIRIAIDAPAAVKAAKQQAAAPADPAQAAPETVVPAALVPADPPSKLKPTSIKQRMEQERAARADYFTPGNIVSGYDGHDEVLSYTPPKADGSDWSVKVRSVVNQDGKWVADPKDGRERIHSTQPDAKKLASGPNQRVQVAPAAVADKDGGHIGRDSKPLSEGGKPFKSKDEASAARKLQPMLRVVPSPSGKGFALAPKTEAQLAAQDKAAKRLSLARTGKAGVPTAAHEFIAGEGGMDSSTRTEFSFGANPRVGNRTLFAGARGGMSIEAATEKLIEARYLPAGASHSDTVALINRSFTQPQYTVDGTEVMAEAAHATRFEDHLAAQQEAAQDGSLDPFDSVSEMGFELDDADWAGYDALEDPIKLEVDALLAQADALGIDTDTIKEGAHEDTRNGSEQDYYDATRDALTSAIEASNRSSNQDAGAQGNAGSEEVKQNSKANESNAKVAPSLPGIYKLEDGQYARFQDGIWFRRMGAPREALKTEFPSYNTMAPKDRGDGDGWTPHSGFTLDAYGATKSLKPFSKSELATLDAGDSAGLTAPTRAEVLAQQERTDNAQALDDRAQIDAEASRQTLTRQNAPEQRRDTSVDMFGEEKAVLESAKKDADAAAKNEAAKDPNQTGMFDEPAQEDADELSQPIDQLRKIARDDDHPGSQEARSELARHGLGYGHGNSDHLIIGSMKPPSEEWMQVQNFRQRGVYELAASDLKRFLKLAKARSLDEFEGQAISDRDSTISKWLAESKPTEPANQATAILDAANITGKERIEALKDVKNGDITPDELKAAYPANESDGKAAESKPSTEATKPPKIEDSGQVLEGARKLYAKNYAAKLDEGTGMDTATVPLSKSWPEPDYQRLIDEGADPWAVAMTRAMRDEVPTKPSSWKLKGWVQKVETLRDIASKVMSGEMTQEKFKTTGGQFNLADWFNKIDLYEAVGHSKSLKTLKFSMGEYGMYGGQTFKPAKKLWTINLPGSSNTSTWASGNWGADLVVADTKAEAIEKFKAWSEAQGEKAPTEAKATSFDIYSYRSKPGITIVGKRINSTKSIDLKEFTSVKEAREYKAGNQTELEALLAKAKFEPSERGESNAPRVGADHRSGADVTSEQFRETFGFRGEQFGASMPQSERQANMNQAYDALMDLAGVVGIPPKALSLNGELGLAFGARGTGGKNPAAAHYERDTTGAVTPNRVVINLTRKNGAGSLAHEWFHAVDNYFARMRGEKAGMLTESHASRGEGVRPEMVAAFKQLMMAIQSSGVRERSKQLDKKRVKDYWSTGLEMAARSFESYVIAKLQDNNGSNDYLANIVPESLYTMQGSYPYPIMGEMPAIRAAFDNFFGAIQTKETEQGMAMFSRSGSGKSDVLSKDGKFKGWPKFNTWTRQEYSDVVSLLPAAYREDAHRREPVAAKDWDALAAAVLPELEALNNAAGEGAFRLDPLGNIVGDVRRHDSSVFSSELVAIANRHDLGIFLTGLRTSSMAPLTEMGFVPEMGLGAILARSTGSTAPVIPMASGTVNNTAYGTMMSYLPRGFAAPMFSKAEGGASQQHARGTPVPRVQAVVDAITAHWANAPEVVVVSDMQDAKVPQKVREADQLQKSQGAEGEPDGFIYKGTVYLVASELPTINDAVRVLFHEALGHSGLRGAFGDALKPILSQVATMRRADVVAKAREYGLLNPDTPHGATVNEQWQAMTEKNRQVAAEEVLAVMAQTQPELGFVKRAVAAIRNWLRTNVPGFKSMLMTDADIIQAFILPARRHIEGKQASSTAKNTSLEAIAKRESNLLDLIACLG